MSLPCSPMEAQLLTIQPSQPFGIYPWLIYVPPGAGQWPLPEGHCVTAPPLLQVGGRLRLLSQLSSSHSIYLVGHNFPDSTESHTITPPSLHGSEGSSFLTFIPSDDMVNSKFVGSIKPDDSGVVIGYWFDEFTCTWLAEHFVA